MAHDLVKRFGSTVALDGVSIEVHDGEVVALMGPNGSGKSTLLRILAGMVMPDAGSATIAGHDVLADRRSAAARTGVALATETAWYGHLSGRENLETFAALAGLRGRDTRPVIESLLEDARLAGVADRAVAEYSRGMRARLAFARSRLASPTVLLLDEPTASLDPDSAASLLAGLEPAGGTRAVIFSTHSVSEAKAVADRAVILREGRVAAELARPLCDGEIMSALGHAA